MTVSAFANRGLYAERRSAAAGALHVRVLELEAGTFQSFNVVNHATVQIHDGSGVDEHLQAVHFESFVHHSGSVFKLHGIGETGTAATDYSDAQACRHGILLAHDLFYFRDRAGG